MPALRAPWRFWAVAYALLILLTGTNLPTPLYRGYEASFGFSPLVVTLIFAAYVAALVPSLLVAGPLSDAVGRRRVLLPALAVAALGSLSFALAQGTAWLFAARVLQGIAVGSASGALTAALTELHPAGDRRKAALVSAVASMGGLGLGPVLAGLVIGVGFLATTVGLLRAVQYFAGAAALLCLLVLILLTRPRRQIPAAAAPPARREVLADRRGRSG